MKARLPAAIPPALRDMTAELTRDELTLARRIAFDLYPERFLARLESPHKVILTQILIWDMRLGRCDFDGNRAADAVLRGFKAALAAVEKVHA